MRHALAILTGSALFATVFLAGLQAYSAEPAVWGPTPAAVCDGNQASSAQPSIAGPMIISYGPPPSTYSPSADFGARVHATPWTAVADNCPPMSPMPQQIYLPPPGYSLCPPGYVTPPSFGAVNLPPPPPFESYDPRQFEVEERIVFRDRLAPAYTAPRKASTSVAWSVPLCKCEPAFATACACNSACADACKSVAACATASTANCPCGDACKCGPNCSCGNASTCSTKCSPAVCATAYKSGFVQCAKECECGAASRVDHILEAVHHLEAAGMQNEADGLRRKCDGEMKAVVEQLKKAQAQIDELNSASATNVNCNNSECKTEATKASQADEACANAGQKQVIVHLEIVEVNRAACRNLGFDFLPMSSAETSNCLAPIQGFLEALKKDDLAKVLCKPTVATLSGRPAQAMIGQHIPVPTAAGSIEYQFAGTELNVVPIITKNGNLHLDLRCKYSEFDATRKLQVDNQQFPLLNKTEIDTGIEIASGQTAVLTGLPQVRTEGSAKPSEVDLMVFVRPEIIGTVSSQPARLTNWTLPFESSNSEFSGPCGAQPVCCDEGSVFSTALKNSAGRCGCECPCDFSKCKNAFPEPASYDPFEPKAIEIPTIKFDLPEVLPASKNCEGEFHTEYAPREFIPQAAKPMRFTRPVVTPVIYEEPVGR